MMDGMMLVRGGRSSSASSAERCLLLGALASHMGVLDARENDAQTIIRKSELWDEITRQFNANTSAPRSRQQIQTLYKNMKAKARRYEVRLSEVSSGVPPPDPDPISEMLLGLLHQQLQHQRRHLQHMVTADTHTSMSEDAPKVSRHYENTFLTPEQVMQVSLKEGLTEVDIKSEPRDDLSSPDKLSDEVTSPSEMFPDCVFGSQYSDRPHPASGVIQSQQFSPPSVGEVHLKTPLPAPYKQSSLAVTNASQNQTASFTSQSSVTASYVSQAAVSLPHASSGAVSPINSFACHSLASGDDPMSEEIFPAIKKPKLESGREMLPEEGGGGVPPRALSLCCCPELHRKMLRLAQEEHHLRMTILKQDSEQRTKEHAARLVILSLEEEMVKGKLQAMRQKDANGDP